MKKTLLALLCLAMPFSCKKADYSASTFQVQVSGLNTKTVLTFTVFDNTENSTVLTETGVSNNTYTSTQQVHPGDQLTIHCKANVNDDLSGDGDGTLKYYFKDNQMGSHGGVIGEDGFNENETVPNP